MQHRDLHVFINEFVHVLLPVAFGVSLNLNLQSQSPWSHFDGTRKKRPGALDHRLRFENEEMTLQMRYHINRSVTRFVGSLILQVSFAKEPYKRDDTLQKRLYYHINTSVTCAPTFIYRHGLISFYLSTCNENKRDDILQKRPMILRSLLIVATPYSIAFSNFNLN